MLKNNKWIITFKDVFNGLSNNNRRKLVELADSINNNDIKSKISIKEKTENCFNYNIANLSYDEITRIKNYINICRAKNRSMCECQAPMCLYKL